MVPENNEENVEKIVDNKTVTDHNDLIDSEDIEETVDDIVGVLDEQLVRLENVQKNQESRTQESST